MFKETSITLPEVALNVAAGPPSGPTLLFLHGVSRAWPDMLNLMIAWHPRWHVHALDFRGHGLSGRAESYLVADHVGDVVHLVQGAFPDGVVLFGHSLGALVALGVAAQLPKLVTGIVLEDPPGPSFMRDLHRTSYYSIFSAMKELAGSNRSVLELTRLLAEVRLPGPNGTTLRFGDVRDETALRFNARCLQRLDPRVLATVLEGGWMAGSDMAAWTRAVACPTLLLRGNEAVGGMLPRHEADVLAQAIADCSLVDVPRVGHLIHHLELETTIRLVTGFLESLR